MLLLQDLSESPGKHLVQPPHLQPLLEWRPDVMIATAAIMVCATLLALPVALIYRRLRTKRAIDTSVLQSILILPAAVAGIVSVVRGSLALAFSLAGVVTAVRFRNSLKDTHDAVYIFFAVAVGLAAGAEVLDMGLALSLVFCATMLVLHWTGLDVVPAHDANRGSESGPVPTPGRQDPTDPAHEPRPTEVMSVHAQQPQAARRIVEAVLPSVAKEWHLGEIIPGGDGESTLEYLVRFKKKVAPGAALEEINTAGTTAGVRAEFQHERSRTP